MKYLQIFLVIVLEICFKRQNCQINVRQIFIFSQNSKITNITGLATNSTLGQYWNLTLTTMGAPQIFEIELTSAQIPGAFYWSQNQIYPTVYVITNCIASCQYNASQNASVANQCAQTPNDTTTAWSLTTDRNITATSCSLQFYLSSTTNQSFNFMYFPEFELLVGQQYQVYFNWSPMLYRYFKYNFAEHNQQIANAQFLFYLSAPPNTLFYFGTTEASFQCNYVFPDAITNCQDVDTFSLNGTYFKMWCENQNSTIYFSVPSNSAKPIVFSINSGYQCFDGYYKPLAQNTCVLIPPCSQGDYFNQISGACTACSDTLSYCKICTSSTTCTECINNFYTLNNGKCTAICSSGQYPNPTSTQGSVTCLSCLQNCISCTNANDCTQCYEPNYTWNSAQKACVSICSSTGQYYNSQSQKCLNCEVQNCITCYGSGLQCAGCANGYEISKLQNGNVQCNKAKDAQIMQAIWCFILITILMFA